MKVWQSGADFKELLLKDENVLKWLNPTEIESYFNYEKILTRINGIFERIDSGNYEKE